MTTNMTGLKQRKTFEEVIDYIQNDKTKIKYPDRTAKFLRNSFELSQLDNAGMILMEQQQMREMKQREKEHLLRQLVANTSKSITEARATHTDESKSTVSADLSKEPQGVSENIESPLTKQAKKYTRKVVSPGLHKPLAITDPDQQLTEEQRQKRLSGAVQTMTRSQSQSQSSSSASAARAQSQPPESESTMKWADEVDQQVKRAPGRPKGSKNQPK